jgi:hypothetical protein
MNATESLNRGFNLLSTSIVALAGFAFLPEAFLENDIPDKVDDTLLFVVGMVGIWWYNRGNNRFAGSWLPFALVIVALLVKVMAIGIEFDDAESVGDDFGGLILFVGAAMLVAYQYFKVARLQKTK